MVQSFTDNLKKIRNKKINYPSKLFKVHNVLFVIKSLITLDRINSQITFECNLMLKAAGGFEFHSFQVRKFSGDGKNNTMFYGEDLFIL